MLRSRSASGGRSRIRSTLLSGATAAALVLFLTSCLSSTPLEDLGGAQSRAFAVNEHGVIVGRTIDEGNLHAFLFDPETNDMSLIPQLSDGHSDALDVNDHGVVVGSSFSHLQPCTIPQIQCPLVIDHAFLYHSTTGTLEDLADFGVGALPPGSNQLAVGSGATGINEAGVVIGTATSIGPPTLAGQIVSVYPRPFAFDSVSDTVTDLSAYGFTSVADINEHGQLLGQIGFPVGQNRAAVLDLTTGILTDIPTVGGTASQGHALNDNGMVVGTSQVTDNIASHAFVYNLATGVMTDIGTLKPFTAAPSSTAHGVSNDGIVVGTSATANGIRAFAYDVPTKVIKDLGVLGTSDSVEARDINDAGIAVGFSHSNPAHAWRTTVARTY